jgi:hypothetical protein
MRTREEDGQALLLLVAALAAVLVGSWALGAIARGVGVQGGAQRAADLGALSAARAMRAAYERLFEPGWTGGRPNPRHLERGDYLRLGRDAARHTAGLNGVRDVTVTFPDASSIAPVRVRVIARQTVGVPAGSRRRLAPVAALAEAELAPPAGLGTGVDPGAGDYPGPFAYRQGKPLRPDVATAFDRLARAARAAGISLLINSAWRSSREQAALFAQHPDPRWVAPPGRSLHRLGTELDLGPPAAYGWLSRNAARFHFIRRYSWEPWHFGFGLNPGSASVGFGRRAAGGDGHSSLPSFVPARFAAPIATAAQRWNVSAALLAAQLYAESNFNPFAVSPTGARGIAQFEPGTAAAYGLRNPFDAARSIDAQGHLMRDLLRQFGSVPLALAAYNAGPGAVARCGCIPPYPETQGYVARILGLLGGAGQIGGGIPGLEVRLVS